MLEDPKSCRLRDPRTWEVTRLCVGPNAPHCAASILLGAAWRVASGFGIRRLVSYTRQDEDGTCYRAAGWLSVALTHSRGYWDNRATRTWLPGFYRPTTDHAPRVRWEIGPEAAMTRVKRSPDGTWRELP